MTRVAALDLGTNSTRLLVADVAGGALQEVARRLTITRLGEGVDERRRLEPAAVARVRACLEGYCRELQSLGAERALAVATSAVRDAADGEDFLAALERDFGLATHLLSGREEAELALRGIASGRAEPLGPETLVVDIGGGSTELTLGGPEGISFTTSLELGCVRLTERFLASDPPEPAELADAAAHVRASLPALEAVAAVGVAGTVTTVAALDLGLRTYAPERTHGHRIARAAVERVFRQLSSLPLADRRRVPGLEPGRAPVIVGGLVVLRELLDAYGLPAIEASERDLLDGAALAAAELPGGMPYDRSAMRGAAS